PATGPQIATIAIGRRGTPERKDVRPHDPHSPAGENWCSAGTQPAPQSHFRNDRIRGETATERYQTESPGTASSDRVPLLFSACSALFFSKLAPYIGGAGSPAMEINDRRNKPFGPGGSTRRLHPSPPLMLRVSAGAKQDRRGRKGRVFSRYGSAVIG